MNGGLREIEEGPGPTPGTLTHPEWAERWPWLVQGVTAAGTGGGGDFALFGTSPSGEVVARWEQLMQDLGLPGAVHARQVHGAAVRVHGLAVPGLHLTPPADGHVTGASKLLLAVTVADCVPVYLVAPEVRAVGVVHAGWRGAARGILEQGVRAFRDRLGVDPGSIHVHLGPSICGVCYEVGPEVHATLGEVEPPGPTPLDLKANLGLRAVAEGLDRARVTRSAHCTRCGDADLYSHRGGDPERQIGFIGVLE